MEYVEKRLCISYDELVEGILSVANLNNLQRRGQVKRIRRGCKGTPALYDIESLPHKYKVEVYRRYPDFVEKKESKTFEETLEVNAEAIRYFSEYTFDDGCYLPLDKQEEYANNVAILEGFLRKIEEANDQRSSLGHERLNLGDFWQRAATALPRIYEKFPHSLPTTAATLRRKANAYTKKGFEEIISGKFKNKSASKIQTEEQEKFLLFLCSHHNNLDNTRIADMYNYQGSIQNPKWKEITSKTVANFKEKYILETSLGQLGANNFSNTLSMQNKRKKPKAAFLLWTLDGWDAELLYQETVENKKGYKETKYHHRMTVVVVLDPSCDYPIGYAIGKHESPALIKEALLNAIQHTKELTGEMLKAYQVQSDHYAMKKLAPLYAIVGHHVTPARVGNAKSKKVERYFLELNKKYCQLCSNWSGYGVTTDPKKQPNSEALNYNKKNFPDAKGVCQQIAGILEIERQRKKDEFLKLFAKLPEDKKIALPKRDYLLGFGSTTGRTNRLQSNGLLPRIQGEQIAFDCFDKRFREHAHEDWTVLYDPNDLSEALAVNKDRTLQFMLESKHIQAMALAERKEGDQEALDRVNEFNKKLINQTKERLQLAQQHVYEKLGTSNERNGILGRFLLVDSKGQHKDNRSKDRNLLGNTEYIEDVEEEIKPKKENEEKIKGKSKWNLF